MKRFFLVWMMVLAGVTNYSRISDSCTGPLLKEEQGITLALDTPLPEELFTIPADGTIFVSRTDDAFPGWPMR